MSHRTRVATTVEAAAMFRGLSRNSLIPTLQSTVYFTQMMAVPGTLDLICSEGLSSKYSAVYLGFKRATQLTVHV